MSETRLFLRDIYNNPTELPVQMLNLVSTKLLGGDPITDPNSPYLLGIEMYSTISAGIIEHTANQFPGLYTRRAQVFEDLYKHLSDYEHIDMFATPAGTSMSLILEKNQLIQNAKSYNDNYYLIQIPKDSVIEFGDYKFGLYYPIKIMIAKNTKLIYITYDDSEPNPLYTLKELNVTFREYKYQLADIIEISLPIHQFVTTKYTEDSSRITSFHKKYTFGNRFYAARIFTYIYNSATAAYSWEELNIVYSETTYDPSDKASAVLKVYSDTNTCEIFIPQVYFEYGKVGSKIKVELYTTLGYIDIDISNLDFSRVKFAIPSQMDNPNKDFAEVLNKLETCHVLPQTSLIVGGTNEADFQTVKRRIENRVNSSSKLLSLSQLKTYYDDIGFSVDVVKDTLEERIYCACGLLTDTQGIPIQVAMDITEVPYDIPAHMEEHVIKDINGITILPTATFKYDNNLKRYIFISAEESETLNHLFNTDKSAFCLFLNNNYFTRPLYHIHLKTENRTPFITNYDLSNPKVNKVRFITENMHTSERLTITSCSLTHNGYEDTQNGTIEHKYELRMKFSKSDGIAALLKDSPDNVKVVAAITSSNVQLIQIAKYDSNNEEFILSWTPTYKFDFYGQMGISVLNQDPNITEAGFTNPYTDEVFLPLDFTLKILTFAYLPDIENATLLPNMDNVLSGIFRQIGLQELEITQGINLHNKLYSSVDVTYQKSSIIDPKYVYTEDVYLTYAEDEYAQDSEGGLLINVNTVNDGSTRIKKPTITQLNNSTAPEFRISLYEEESFYETYDIQLLKTHLKGDPILVNGQPQLIHKAGDLKTDVNGYPLVNPREIVYMGNILHVGLNLFYSELTITEAIQNITARTSTQYNLIAASSSRLLENTYIVYRPYTGIGYGKFYVDNLKVISHPLDISLRFKCYVPEHVLNDITTQKQIRSRIIAISEKYMLTTKLSVIEIVNSVMNEFSEIIKHIDIYGINNDISIQMIENMESTKQPILKQELWLDDNGLFILNKAVIVQFVQ